MYVVSESLDLNSSLEGTFELFPLLEHSSFDTFFIIFWIFLFLVMDFGDVL